MKTIRPSVSKIVNALFNSRSQIFSFIGVIFTVLHPDLESVFLIPVPALAWIRIQGSHLMRIHMHPDPKRCLLTLPMYGIA